MYPIIQEVFGRKEKNNWFARRETGEWYTVSDAPYGYCELESIVNSDVVFEIVDKEGNICFTNEDEENIKNFPFIHDKCVQEWNEVKVQFNSSRDGFKKWICSYMDLNKYTKFKNSMSSTVWEDNWSCCYYDIEHKEVVKTFKYLGSIYEISKLHCKHKICDEKWYEYMVGKKGDDSYIYYAGWEKL